MADVPPDEDCLSRIIRRFCLEAKQWGERVARRWEIAENLHRAELTDLQRKEQVAEWIGLVEAEASPAISDQVDRKIGRGRPKGGIGAAARELPLPGKTEDARRISAQRAVRVAAIAPEAKAAVQAAGLDNNQKALLRVAAEKTPERQVEAVEVIVASKTAEPEVTFETWIEQGRR